MNHRNNENNVDIVPANLSLQIESAENIKENLIQVMDEFNDFSKSEDMMEALRKEVEKVVETIKTENDCSDAQ
jgi:hypothetical protein